MAAKMCEEIRRLQESTQSISSRAITQPVSLAMQLFYFCNLSFRVASLEGLTATCAATFGLPNPII